MQILQLVGIGLTATVIVVVLRERMPQFAMMVGLMAGIVLFLAVLGPMQDVVHALTDLAQAARVDQGFLGTVLKIIGIAYIVEFAAQVARDAHEGALAGKIELVGKVGIVVLALPIITGVVESLVHLLP
ncbi:stage III sporulation protein AD [Alicyclobacillus macrosporangiidus]|uniref:stage III sporulation protein AD n=1 Tax=Alicyclobacillus macrosporangiidus TaxID=392015 RepID=UPI0004969D5D|nr:stage III sporulation protein AD [Alicyclobacillus macrosporangiidus]MCL6598446.1 stage III sporulation protein AD [Alicyclobacillus macrosporangiidus]